MPSLFLVNPKGSFVFVPFFLYYFCLSFFILSRFQLLLLGTSAVYAFLPVCVKCVIFHLSHFVFMCSCLDFFVSFVSPKVSRLPEDARSPGGGDQGPHIGRPFRHRRPQADAATAGGRAVQAS